MKFRVEIKVTSNKGISVSKELFRAKTEKKIKARGGDPDGELPKWTPYQLRHTAATRTRRMFNYETAGALLGHSNMSATAIYGVPGRAHLLGGASPLWARQREPLAGRQGCRS